MLKFKPLAISLHVLLAVSSTTAQQFSFNMREVDGGTYTVSVDLTNKRVSATRNGSTEFNYTYTRYQYDNQKGIIGFAFNSGSVPMKPANDFNTQYFLVRATSIYANKPSSKKGYKFEPTNMTNYVAEYSRLIDAVSKSQITYTPTPSNNVSSSSGSFQTCPDSNHPHMIDLGLPSGTKWACCNVGAAKPEGYGNYYAWGETETKTTYNDKTYKYRKNKKFVSIGFDISSTSYDVSYMKWGGSWKMPSLDQIRELLNNCTLEWTTVNDVKGRMFKGKNGNSVFLPAAGRRWDDDLRLTGSYGYYWASSQNALSLDHAYYIYLNSDNVGWYSGSREYGQTVRPVSR